MYGAVFLTYNLSPNSKVPGLGVMTRNASAIDEDGELNTASLSGVYDRNGHEMKTYCVDDISDGNINVAVVTMNVKTSKVEVVWSQLDR